MSLGKVLALQVFSIVRFKVENNVRAINKDLRGKIAQVEPCAMRRFLFVLFLKAQYIPRR